MKHWNVRIILVSVLLVLLLVAVTPAAATTLQIDLSKDYQFKATNLSHINTVDLWDPSVSKVEIQSTTSDNTDVRVIQKIPITYLNRTFTSTTGTFAGNTIHVIGPLKSVIDYTGVPTDRYYINHTVPTFRITAPGYTGNPFVTKYNDSWKKEDAGLFRVATAIYLFNESPSKGYGILYSNNELGNNFVSWGDIDTKLVDSDNLPFTLNNNKVTLNPYAGDAGTSSDMADFTHHLAGKGKWFVGALSQDETTETATIYALSPLIILKHETPIQWSDNTGTNRALPPVYSKGQNGDVKMSFGNADPATTPTNVTYLFVDADTSYLLNVTIDTNQLAQNANDRWSVLEPSGKIISLLYNALSGDIGTAYTYNLNAVGQESAPNADSLSQIAITPGYGISGPFNLYQEGDVTINIYTIGGRMIKTLIQSGRSFGYNQIYWDGRDADGSVLANGVYFYKITVQGASGEASKIGKIVVMK